jgi:hypothetical protein
MKSETLVIKQKGSMDRSHSKSLSQIGSIFARDLQVPAFRLQNRSLSRNTNDRDSFNLTKKRPSILHLKQAYSPPNLHMKNRSISKNHNESEALELKLRFQLPKIRNSPFSKRTGKTEHIGSVLAAKRLSLILNISQEKEPKDCHQPIERVHHSENSQFLSASYSVNKIITTNANKLASLNSLARIAVNDKPNSTFEFNAYSRKPNLPKCQPKEGLRSNLRVNFNINQSRMGPTDEGRKPVPMYWKSFIKKNTLIKLGPFDASAKARSSKELNTLWMTATAVDPSKLADKSLAKMSSESIARMLADNTRENITKVTRFAEDITTKIHEDISRITEPVRNNIQAQRRKLLFKITEFLSFVNKLDIPKSLVLQFPIRPYQHSRSIEFIVSAKLGKIERIQDLILRESNLLVYEFDHFRLTALHWAAKRDFWICAESLLEASSYINALDVYGRTPLFYAIRNQNVGLVYMMLIRGASPWSSREANFIELAEGNVKVISYIKKFRVLDLMLKFQKPAAREEFRQYYLKTKVKRFT